MFSINTVKSSRFALAALLLAGVSAVSIAHNASATSASAPAPTSAAQSPAQAQSQAQTQAQAQVQAQRIAALRASEARLRVFIDSMREVRARNENARAQAVKLREDVLTIVTAEKFDAQAFMAKNAEIDKLNSQIRAAITQAAASAFAQFSKAERVQLLQIVSAARSGNAVAQRLIAVAAAPQKTAAPAVQR